IMQESRLFNVDTGETVTMRSKESAHDYRYFPEPDLVPLRVSEAWQQRALESMPELPAARRERIVGSYGLRDYDAQVLTATREISDYFEQVVQASGDPRASANWVMGDLAALLKAEDKDIADSPVTAANLGKLIAMIRDGKLTGKLAKEIFPKMFASGDAPDAIM